MYVSSKKSALSAPYGKKRQSSFQKIPFEQDLATSQDSIVKVKQTVSKKNVPSQKYKPSKTYDEKTEKKFEEMLTGRMDDLPNIPKSVRIFISSTFSDMRAERNILVRDVFPKLKQFCASKGLDFQVVDMRWGVTEDSQNDHSVEKICLQEISNCQKMSIGPNFVAIIGNRYGFRPIPVEINANVFEILKSFAKEDNEASQDIKLLDTWYKLDENADPPQYVLQPIRSQFPFFGDYSQDADEQRVKQTQEWEKTYTSLQCVLRKTAALAHEGKKLTDSQLQQYFYSVTEMEIERGILLPKDPKSHVMVFHREITGFTEFEDNMTKRHIDTTVTDGKTMVDQEVKGLQNRLKQLIIKKLGRGCSHDFKVEWTPSGLESSSRRDHQMYLNQFCEYFIGDMKDMIELAIHKRKVQIRKHEFYSDYHEILHHLHFCHLKFENFCGQETVLDAAKQYILDDTNSKPFVIHAPSGYGKTSIMAMIMKSLPLWFNGNEHVGIIRFLGTSAMTLTIYEVLLGVCFQLADVADIMMEPFFYKKMKNLKEYMPRFWRRAMSVLKRPVVILLDSLDQLSSAYDAYELHWLSLSLPRNFKLIISVLPKEHNILDKMREILPDKQSFVEVSTLPQQTGIEIMKKHMAKRERKITEDQQQFLLEMLSKCPEPLFLKLLLDEAAKWNSFTTKLVLKDTAQAGINHLFDNLEIKFGQVITSHALGYITIGLEGLSENELEDVLSCDDEALDDVYRYHDPPVDGIVRVPPVLVARIRYEIRDYIVERVSHEKYTMNWYHRQFSEAARTRYASGETAENLHRNLAEIFLYEDGIKKDITLSRRKLTIPNADRQVTQQPVVSQNRRLLSCLPYHIIRAKKALPPPLVKEKCWLNFNFIWSKIFAFGIDKMVDELKEYSDLQTDSEIIKIRKFLVTKKEQLVKANKLAVNLLAGISFDAKETHLKKLRQQSEEFLNKNDTPCFIPVYPCLAPRKEDTCGLIYCCDGVSQILSNNGDVILVKMKSREGEEENEHPYAIFNISTQEMKQVQVPDIPQKFYDPCIEKVSKNVIYVSNESITVVDFASGNTTTKQFQEIIKDKTEVKIVFKTMSKYSSHMAVFFDNRDFIVLDTVKLLKTDHWKMNCEPENILGIVIPMSDNLNVLVALNSPKSNCGELHVFSTGKLDPVTFKFDQKISESIYGLSDSDCLFSFGSVFKKTFKLCTIEVGSGKQMQDIALPTEVTNISFSESNPFSCVQTKEGKIMMLNVRKGLSMFTLTLNNPVTYFVVSETFSAIFLGDDHGQIRFHDITTGNYTGSFQAHFEKVQNIGALDDYLISLGEDEMKCWSLLEIFEDITGAEDEGSNSITSGLLLQRGVTTLDLHPNGEDLVAVSNDKCIRVWTLNDAQFRKEFNIGIAATKLLFGPNDSCFLIDKKIREMKVVNVETTKEVNMHLPNNILDMTLGKESLHLYLLHQNESSLSVSIINLKNNCVEKSFTLKSKLQFESIDIYTSYNERYMCLKSKLLPAEFKTVAASWAKSEVVLMPQVHPFKFTAVDLQQATGDLMPFLRRMTKDVPVLGEEICANVGNFMMISTRRNVVIWDIPLGRYVRTLRRINTKKKVGKSHNSDDKDENHGSNKALVKSNDNSMLAVGSDDGYLYIFDIKSGSPIGGHAPVTKHSAEVIKATFSPDNLWVLSACKNNIVKLWDCATAKEVFSMRVNAEVQQMKFSTDSKQIVICTGKRNTRVLIFRLHPGIQQDMKRKT